MMFNRIAVMVLMLISIAITAFAKGGIIEYIDTTTIVVSTELGYTCANLIGVTLAGSGDVVYGIHDGLGLQEWELPRFNSSFAVFVEEYWDSADEAIRYIRHHRY